MGLAISQSEGKAKDGRIGRGEEVGERREVGGKCGGRKRNKREKRREGEEAEGTVEERTLPSCRKETRLRGDRLARPR